jgi:hypothetical protein
MPHPLITLAQLAQWYALLVRAAVKKKFEASMPHAIEVSGAVVR